MGVRLNHRMRAPLVLFAGALAATGSLMGCGGSGKGGGADGQTIVVGLINTEGASVGSFPELRRGVLAAEQYVQDHGGVNGQHLRIVACNTIGTPESSQACAYTVLAQHPVAVIGGVDLGAASSLTPLTDAGVPYVGATPVATAALTSHDAFMLSGGPATEVLGEVAYAVDSLHATRMSGVYTDVPGLLSQAALLLTTIVHKKGVASFPIVPIAADAPDVVPSLTAANRGDPPAILAVLPAETCTRVARAAGQLHLQKRMLYPSLCAEQAVLDAAGSAIEGSMVAEGYVPFTETTDPDVAIYLAALHTYAPDLKPSLLSQAGFSVTMNLTTLLARLPAQPGASALMSALSATHDEPSFMGHPYTCDGAQVSQLRALCSSFVRLSRIENGTLVPVGDWVDTAPLAALATG